MVALAIIAAGLLGDVGLGVRSPTGRGPAAAEGRRAAPADPAYELVSAGAVLLTIFALDIVGERRRRPRDTVTA